MLEELFFRGDYAQVLKLTVDSPRGRKLSLEELGIVIGALSFVGRVREGEILYANHESGMSRERKIQCRFFLGIGYTRVSDYAKARACFGANIREADSKVSSHSKFYASQGLGFYRYFCGRFDAALKAAERAFEAAVSADFLYGKVLSSDLSGHLLVQTRNVDLGLKRLTQAKELSLALANTTIAGAIDISSLCYEAQFGLDSRKILGRLRKKIRDTDDRDTYSRASLLLELARQLSIRGNIPDADAALEQASRLIYVNQHRRQQATLNLRYAYSSHLAGDGFRALGFVQAAKRILDPAVDSALELAAGGLELKITSQLGICPQKETLTEKIDRMSRRFGGSINRRILSRAGEFAGDRIGDLRDRMNSEPQAAIVDVLRSGYLAFLYELLPIPPSKQIIYVDLAPDSLALFDRGNVEFGDGLTPLLRSVVAKLMAGPQSKEQLIESIWGYKYHPLRHDPLVYTTLTSLRKLLGSRHSWIETTENGYRLSSQVEVVFKEEREASESRRSAAAAAPAPGPRNSSQLNYRQLKLLDGIHPEEFIHVKSYGKRFKISEITACRDLAILSRLGLMVKVGRARATRYMLPKGN